MVGANVALMLCTLACVGVTVTWQEDMSVVFGTTARVQVPVIVSAELELTVMTCPTPGLVSVPVDSLSVTVTVAVVLCP